MLSRILSILALCSLMTAANAGDRFGLARSSEDFSIYRASNTVDGRANVLTSVEKGDTLQAGDRPLQIDLPKGNSFALGRNSRALVAEDGTIVLEEGHLAASTNRNNQIAVGHEDLKFVSSNKSVTRPDSPGMIAMTVLEPGKVKVIASNDIFTAEHSLDSTSRQGVAVLGHNDALVFVKRNDKWLVFPERMGQPVNDQATVRDSSVEDDDDDKAAAWWPWAAGGAVAAAGIGYWIYEEEEDEEDDEHREERNREREEEEGRGIFTPPGPPDEPPGRPDDPGRPNRNI